MIGFRVNTQALQTCSPTEKAKLLLSALSARADKGFPASPGAFLSPRVRVAGRGLRVSLTSRCLCPPVHSKSITNSLFRGWGESWRQCRQVPALLLRLGPSSVPCCGTGVFFSVLPAQQNPLF